MVKLNSKNYSAINFKEFLDKYIANFNSNRKFHPKYKKIN